MKKNNGGNARSQSQWSGRSLRATSPFSTAVTKRKAGFRSQNTQQRLHIQKNNFIAHTVVNKTVGAAEVLTSQGQTSHESTFNSI